MTNERDGRPTGAAAASKSAHQAHSLERNSQGVVMARSLERKSSLERLAQLEELVEAKQRELSERGVIPESLGSARATLERQPARATMIASNRRLAAKVDDLELELEEMRRRTQDICERVARLERERCHAPDAVEMLAGASHRNVVFDAPAAPNFMPPHMAPSGSGGGGGAIGGIVKPVRFSRQRVDREGLITPEPTHPTFVAPSPVARALSPSWTGRPAFFGPSPSTAFVNFR
jgi:septal ring factor EnvC (AmiA/AmiB activator)